MPSLKRTVGIVENCLFQGGAYYGGMSFYFAENMKKRVFYYHIWNGWKRNILYNYVELFYVRLKMIPYIN